MAERQETDVRTLVHRRLYLLPLALALVLLAFAVIAQPDLSLFQGLWEIQLSETGLITDPMTTGGVGAALLNAALVLLICTALIRFCRPKDGLLQNVGIQDVTKLINND